MRKEQSVGGLILTDEINDLVLELNLSSREVLIRYLQDLEQTELGMKSKKAKIVRLALQSNDLKVEIEDVGLRFFGKGKNPARLAQQKMSEITQETKARGKGFNRNPATYTFGDLE